MLSSERPTELARGSVLQGRMELRREHRTEVMPDQKIAICNSCCGFSRGSQLKEVL